MIDDDDHFREHDNPCPKCGKCTVRSRDCDAIDCDEGWIDAHEYDPINYGPGEAYQCCDECHGTGMLIWCAACGTDVQWLKIQDRKEHSET